MADAFARHAQKTDEDAAIVADPPAGRAAIPWTRARIWGWLALIPVFAAFLLVGSVTVGAGNWTGWHMRIVRIWQRFTEYLVGEGASNGAVLAISATVLVALAGGTLLIFLALGLGNDPAERADHPRGDL